MILSLLSMSVEGAVDMVGNGHLHDDETVHHQFDTAPDDAEPESDEQHCERCCHGHVSFVNLTASSSGHINAFKHKRAITWHILNDIQAPPTPPPNA